MSKCETLLWNKRHEMRGLVLQHIEALCSIFRAFEMGGLLYSALSTLDISLLLNDIYFQHSEDLSLWWSCYFYFLNKNILNASTTNESFPLFIMKLWIESKCVSWGDSETSNSSLIEKLILKDSVSLSFQVILEQYVTWIYKHLPVCICS